MKKDTFGNNRMNNGPKFKLHLTEYEIDLVIKCLIIGYRYKGELIFSINETDKENLFYLHRVLSCKANEFFYNKINNDFFILKLSEDEKDN